MIPQLLLCYVLEDYYKTPKFLFLYFFSGIGGNLFSAANNENPRIVGVGASTSTFGFFALQLFFYLEHRKKLGDKIYCTLLVYFFLVGQNLVAGLKDNYSGIDGYAHLGLYLYSLIL